MGAAVGGIVSIAMVWAGSVIGAPAVCSSSADVSVVSIACSAGCSTLPLHPISASGITMSATTKSVKNLFIYDLLSMRFSKYVKYNDFFNYKPLWLFVNRIS